MPVMLDDAFVEGLFPPERTDRFFEFLFGGSEEGAYDICLRLRKESSDFVDLSFDLHQRPGKCLVCSLTYGLGPVFQRHPVIDAKGLAASIAEKKGWEKYEWSIGTTREESESLHWIPFRVSKV